MDCGLYWWWALLVPKYGKDQWPTQSACSCNKSGHPCRWRAWESRPSVVFEATCAFSIWVVPTTFIIKHRQLPAQRFVHCLVFLWNEITRQTLWNESHSLPRVYFFSISFLFHSYFISISFLFHIYFIPTQLFISLVARYISFLFHIYFIPVSCGWVGTIWERNKAGNEK